MMSASEISRNVNEPISRVLSVMARHGIEPEIKRVNLSLYDLAALERVREVLAAEQAVRTVENNVPAILS